MFSYIWHTFFFDPIYNTLVLFIDLTPTKDVGIAIIATVFVVKFVLLPLSIKAVKTQKIMKEIEPKLKELKEKNKDDREALARAMMELYKEAGLNPFASIFVILLQIPLVIALYFAVSSGGGVALPEINTELLYSFIPNPGTATMNFLGLIDIASKSLPLALAAGVAQYAQVVFTMPALAPKAADAEPSFKDDFMRTMQLQLRYVMPVIIFFVAYTISAAIALYFLVSSVVAIGQEYVVRKHR